MDKTGALVEVADLAEARRLIESAFGAEALVSLDGRAAEAVEVIPTGALSLDLALGVRGFPRGRIVEVYGPESSGKTTLMYHAIAEAQRAGGCCAFVDAEQAMDPAYARAIGIDTDTLLLSLNPTTASRRSRSSTYWCARARWRWSRSTRWPR